MEALLITDADVIFEPAALRTMTRHLADPAVGAVTCYIKEGSRPGNYLTRFIGYEYITAQAAARRGQNVLGARRLPGRRRAAALAGQPARPRRPDRHHLAGRGHVHHLRDPAARAPGGVRAARHLLGGGTRRQSRPCGSSGCRWARGNVQVTIRYRGLWFRPVAARTGSAASPSGIFWFCLFLQPVFMITSSAALLTLYFAAAPRAWSAFHVLWITNAATYIFITGFALLIDPSMARRTWRQARAVPRPGEPGHHPLHLLSPAGPGAARAPFAAARLAAPHVGWLIVFVYAWLGGSMAVAYLAKAVEPRRAGRRLGAVLLYVVGYGSLLCACTFASYVKELRHADMTWDKTEKTGKVTIPT